MSHELRTPMNGIVGMSDILLESPLSEPQRDNVRVIKGCAEALLGIINDILDLSKIEAGKFELVSDTFSVDSFLDDVVEMLSPKAAQKSIELDYRMEAGTRCRVMGDAGRIRQIVPNLLSNAIKFTDAGAVSLLVTRRNVGDHYAQLQFSVSDTGTGIPEEKLASLFRSFSQLDPSLTRRHGGTGLGLAICKHLAELMGGQITVQSVFGSGSTFTFNVTLPVAQALAPTPTPLSSAEQKFPGIRILLAEDNAINQKVAVHILERLGCAVDVASNGEIAVIQAMSGRYNAILMDCQMPSMDGYEAAETIRRLEPEGRRTPIAALTAHTMKGDRDRCLRSGMDDFISKPIQISEVIRFLKEWTSPAPLTALAAAVENPQNALAPCESRERI